jgi:type VI secretion system secreted protein VgrG
MEEEEAQRSIVSGASGCRHFTAGYKFTLSGHGRPDFDGDYVLTSVRHSAQEHGYDPGGDENEFTYVNAFTCIPAPVPYRPARMTPKPLIQGAQTAEVVGTKGEEIYTDKFGRVKVQFHWDREGKKDENSSCWIRVSHPWAGKGWGSVSIPRIGLEVIVDFLEGDPDQPLITGRVYNGELMPPYGLPAGGVVSGLKSNSTKGGGGYNEMSMDDTKGKEKIVVHGQYDMTRTIEHNLDGKVGNDRTESVGNNETLSVTTDRKRSVGGSETITVGASRSHTVTINESIMIGAAQEVTIGGLQAITVGAVRTVMVGANQAVNVGVNHSVTVGGKQSLKVASDDDSVIGGKRTEKVAKDYTTTVAGARTSTVTKAEKVKAKTITLEADDEIVLQTGSAKIVMKKSGDITISGKKIEVKGTQAIEEEAANVTVKASAVCTIKGSMVKIN